MQSSSILCSLSNSLNCSPCFSPSRILPPKHICSALKSFGNGRLQSTSLRIDAPFRSIACSTATGDLVETISSSVDFVETGYIFRVHGLKGEVRIKPKTDFPDLRFSKPGLRWLKRQVSGVETLEEIELVEGRGHPGQSWIVRFTNIDSVEQAQKLVGSTILVKDVDRPVLEDGEFYTKDLIGMTVILKESGEPIGTVVNVFNFGASDTLHVELNSIGVPPEQNGKPKLELDGSFPLVWVPFVKAIVPTVDLEKREMLITPPKGLLEVNIRSDPRSKKERRQIEWKERKRFQRRLITAKKKLCEMEQQHVFHGFGHGQKDQAKLLSNQIVAVNSKLLQQALQNTATPSTRPNLSDILNAIPTPNTMKLTNARDSSQYFELQRKGHHLNSSGKVALCLVLEDIEDREAASEGSEDACLRVKALLDDPARFVEIEDRPSMPLVLISSADAVSFLQEMFSNHEFFGFDPEKIWFLEEEKLPIVSSSSEEPVKHKILMKSPWEFLQSSIGSGGVVSLLSSEEALLDELSESGVEYFEICKMSRNHEHSQALLGLVESCIANIGVLVVEDMASEEDLDVIFSMSFFRKFLKQQQQTNKLLFSAVATCSSYVEKVDKNWVDIVPSAPNSYRFCTSIYSCLDVSPASQLCLLDTTE